MPKKDPITGCMVMTQAEFWAKEAEHEGKGRSAGELMEEFYNEMETERKKEEDDLRTPEKALVLIQHGIKEENRYFRQENKRLRKQQQPLEKLTPMPVKVLEVVSAEFRDGFGGGSTKLTVIAETKRGWRGTLRYESWHSNGSFYEPPDGEVSIVWEWRKK